MAGQSMLRDYWIYVCSELHFSCRLLSCCACDTWNFKV